MNEYRGMTNGLPTSHLMNGLVQFLKWEESVTAIGGSTDRVELLNEAATNVKKYDKIISYPAYISLEEISGALSSEKGRQFCGCSSTGNLM
jgi:hypothetical protein